MTNILPIIGISMGDPAGIGPEIAAKALALREIYEIMKFAAGVPCAVVPYASSSLKGFKLGAQIRMKVGEPIEVKRNIKKEERYDLANRIIEQIQSMKAELDTREA